MAWLTRLCIFALLTISKSSGSNDSSAELSTDCSDSSTSSCNQHSFSWKESRKRLEDWLSRTSCIVEELTRTSDEFLHSRESFSQIILSEVAAIVLEVNPTEYENFKEYKQRKSYLRRLKDCIDLDEDSWNASRNTIKDALDPASSKNHVINKRSGGYGDTSYGGDSLNAFLLLASKVVAALIAYLGYILAG